MEWEIPRDTDSNWSDGAKKLHADWWEARIARQKEIDASIAVKAEFKYLYDKPYEHKKIRHYILDGPTLMWYIQGVSIQTERRHEY